LTFEKKKNLNRLSFERKICKTKKKRKKKKKKEEEEEESILCHSLIVNLLLNL